MNIASIAYKSYIREYGLVVLFAGIFFIPSLFSGGRGYFASFLYFIFLCAIVLFYKKNFALQKNLPSIFLILFLLWISIGFFTFSIVSFSPLKLLFPLFVGVIIFLSRWSIISHERLAQSILAAATLLALIGIVFFFFSQNYSYLRLSSTFYNHNG